MATDYTSRLTIAQENLARAKKAYHNALNAQAWETRDGQSVRSVTNASIAVLAREYAKWQKEVDTLQNLVDGKLGGSAFRVGMKL